MSKTVRMYYGGTATKHVCGTGPMEVVALHPGVHEYKQSDLEKIKTHPDVVQLLKDEKLCTEETYLAKLGKKPQAKKAPEQPKADEPAPADESDELESMLSGNAKDTLEMVSGTDDKAVLEQLLEAEKSGKKRKSVMDAIAEKLK